MTNIKKRKLRGEKSEKQKMHGLPTSWEKTPQKESTKKGKRRRDCGG